MVTINLRRNDEMTEHDAVVVPTPLRFSEIEMLLVAEGYTARETFPITATSIEQKVLKMCTEYCASSAAPGRVKSVTITYR
jgi:hypothetical protein